MIRRLTAGLLCVAAVLSVLSGVSVSAGSVSDTALSVANGIIEWKKRENGSTDFLLNGTFLELAGSTSGDWYPIGLSRLCVADRYSEYLAVVKDRVAERYREPGRLSAAKATEWHRISLAVLAAGGDPTSIGTDENGRPIDLIADGTYNRGKTTSLGRQGVNGWIWGLIALDSMRYEVPAGACYTRDGIITEILRQQLSDGGFALSGGVSDPDITAMAIQALAPYYNSEKQYTCTQDGSVTKTVHTVVEEALTCLSEMQLDTGDFKSFGTQNAESTDQVLVALCSLGIDPLEDPRFIKNGHTLLDGILRYRMDDGGFTHSFTYDPENPGSVPNASNTMTGEQTLYAMAALWRRENGMRTLYDFRPEQSRALKQRIADLETQIAASVASAGRTQLTELLAAFYSIPEEERSYVRNYRLLSDAAGAAGIDIKSVADTTAVVESPQDGGDPSTLLVFSDADRRAADGLPQRLTTGHYVLVTTLLDKLMRSEDFARREEYLQRLTEARESIAAIRAEIDRLNAEILERLYPFEALTLRDKKSVDDIAARIMALSEYDRTEIDHFDDVIRAKTQLDSILRGIVIAVLLCIAAAVIAVLLIRRIGKRRRRRERELKELAALYETEDI